MVSRRILMSAGMMAAAPLAARVRRGRREGIGKVRILARPETVREWLTVAHWKLNLPAAAEAVAVGNELSAQALLRYAGTRVEVYLEISRAGGEGIVFEGLAGSGAAGTDWGDARDWAGRSFALVQAALRTGTTARETV